jgi:hypothetical protein
LDQQAFRFTLWELHNWHPCETCGLRGEELTERVVLGDSRQWSVDGEPARRVVVTAPPLARFLSHEDALKVFADDLTTEVIYEESIPIVTMGDADVKYLAGKELGRESRSGPSGVLTLRNRQDDFQVERFRAEWEMAMQTWRSQGSPLSVLPEEDVRPSRRIGSTPTNSAGPR